MSREPSANWRRRTTKKQGAADMTNRHRPDRDNAHTEAIVRDIMATISRLPGESDLDNPDRSGDEIVTTFLHAIELDDRTVDELWSELPAADINEQDLLAAVYRLTDRTE